jgi:hypothetical protein
MKRRIACLALTIAATPIARADDLAVENLGDALAYMVACPGRLWYDLNVMHAYAEEHKLEWKEGTADFAEVEARARNTIELLLTRPTNDVCVEGYRFYGTFGTKAPRFLTRW